MEAAEAEAKLRAAESRYRTLVEQIPAVTFMAVLGEGTNEVYVSPHIETMLGFTQKEWLENPFLWYSQLHPGDRGLWHDVFAKGCHTGGPFRADCRFIARDGREVFVHGEARLVKDDIGRPLFLQGIAFDITEIREAQEKAVRAEKLATIGQFAASVGHDLRNPLAAVRNAGTYIAKRITGSALEREDPRIGQFLALMDRELNACTKIIADLLDFARERPPALTATPLRALVAEAMAVVQAPSTVALANEVPRHGAQRPEAHLRAAIHDQDEGHRPGPGHRRVDRPPTPGHHRGRQHLEPGVDLHHPASPAGCGGRAARGVEPRVGAPGEVFDHRRAYQLHCSASFPSAMRNMATPRRGPSGWPSTSPGCSIVRTTTNSPSATTISADTTMPG
jgi:PAS domain S-box-containing protein